MSNDKPKGIPTRLWILVIFSIIVAVLLIVLYFLKFSSYLAENRGILGCFDDNIGNILGSLARTQDVWGQFGDYVGGILNPLFSLTALFALLYTIHLQSDELHESTKQLTISANALTLQNNVMARQQFETTFFQMLGLFNNVVREMELPRDKIKGRLCMMELGKQIQASIKENAEQEKLKNIKINHQPIKSIDILYKEFHNQYRYLRNQYFLTLYSIIKFVDNSNLSDVDKKFYTNIIRAQFSEHELALLFYHCIYLDEAQEKFLPLIKKYKLLKHVHKNLLANPAHCELLGL